MREFASLRLLVAGGRVSVFHQPLLVKIYETSRLTRVPLRKPPDLYGDYFWRTARKIITRHIRRPNANVRAGY